MLERKVAFFHALSDYLSYLLSRVRFSKVFFHPSLSEFGVKYLLPLSCRYEQYVEDAYVAFLKQKGQAEQVRLESIMNNDELN